MNVGCAIYLINNFFTSLVCCKTSIRPPEIRFHCLRPQHTKYVYQTVQLVLFCLMKFYIYKYIIKTKCTKGCSKKRIFFTVESSGVTGEMTVFFRCFRRRFLYNYTEESSLKAGRRPVPRLSLRNHIISALVSSGLE